MKKLVNLACGSIYINNHEWYNLDFNSDNSKILNVNLLGSLPFKSNSIDLVYSSHFIEHLDHEDLNNVVKEIHRILKPEGILRISTPNYEFLAREYINLIEAENHNDEVKNKIKFIKLLIIDQIYRTKGGGKLKDFYSTINNELANYCEYIGGVFKRNEIKRNRKIFKKLKRITINKVIYKLRLYISWIVAPDSFRNNNMCMCQPGELHKWLFDYFELKDILSNKGFKDIYKMNAGDTNSSYELDIRKLEFGKQKLDRKGKSNLIIECKK